MLVFSTKLYVSFFYCQKHNYGKRRETKIFPLAYQRLLRRIAVVGEKFYFLRSLTSGIVLEIIKRCDALVSFPFPFLSLPSVRRGVAAPDVRRRTRWHTSPRGNERIVRCTRFTRSISLSLSSKRCDTDGCDSLEISPRHYIEKKVII